MHGISVLTLILFKMYVSYNIILKLIMSVKESETVFIQNFSLNDISNALIWAVSRKK